MNQYEIDYQQGYDTANDKWLDRIKQARKELDEMSKYTSVTGVTHYRQLNRDDVLAILDKLIVESET
jgi:hypothetical protein